MIFGNERNVVVVVVVVIKRERLGGERGVFKIIVGWLSTQAYKKPFWRRRKDQTRKILLLEILLLELGVYSGEMMIETTRKQCLHQQADYSTTAAAATTTTIAGTVVVS